MDCGERYGTDLVGHHVINDVYNIRLAIAVKHSWEVFIRELYKVIFLCKSCHDSFTSLPNGTKTWQDKNDYYKQVLSYLPPTVTKYGNRYEYETDRELEGMDRNRKPVPMWG